MKTLMEALDHYEPFQGDPWLIAIVFVVASFVVICKVERERVK